VEALADLWCEYVQRFSGDWMPGCYEMQTLLLDLEEYEKLIQVRWPKEVAEDVYSNLASAFCQMVGLVACGLGSKQILQGRGLSQDELQQWKEVIEGLLDEWCWLGPSDSPLFTPPFRWAMATSLGVVLPKKLPQILHEFGGLKRLGQFADLIKECLTAAQKAPPESQKLHFTCIWQAPAKFALQSIHYLQGLQRLQPPEEPDREAEGLIELLLGYLFAAVSPMYPESIHDLAQILHEANFKNEKARKPFATFFTKLQEEDGCWQQWQKWSKERNQKGQAFQEMYRKACLHHDLRGIVTDKPRTDERVTFFKTLGLHDNRGVFVPKLVVSAASEKPTSYDCELLDLSQHLGGCRLRIRDRPPSPPLAVDLSIRVRLPYPGAGGHVTYLEMPGFVREHRTAKGGAIEVHARLDASDSGDLSAFCAYYNGRFDGLWSVALTPRRVITNPPS
jgi:hypothetical protein